VRAGKARFIEGAKVMPNGAVAFEGEEFHNPSTLAVAMVRHSGGKPTALNGFDYVFVRAGSEFVPLKRLRDELTMTGRRRLDGDRGTAGLVAEARAMGIETTPEDHEMFLKRSSSERKR
jgi:hypothetical protein